MPSESKKHSTDVPSPVGQLPSRDYGAETLRNYRYQSAYAVALLVAAATKKLNYIAVWCEQEDDILAQIAEKSFDSYQIKTRKPELGEWCLTDEALVSAIEVFLRLNAEFPGCIQNFNFVSNAECLESDAANKTHLCPKRLATGAKAKSAHAEFSETEKKGFDALLAKIDTTPKTTSEALFKVIQRLSFVKSPSRESFIAELAQNHLRELDWCQLPQPKLETVVWSLIEIVDRASSLSSQDSTRHLARLAGVGQPDPQLTAKRITVEDFVLRSRELANPVFRYLPSLTTSPLQQTSRDLKRFNQKLKQGGLDDYAHSLRNQTLSAEAAFLDLATRGAEGQADLAQIENVVKAECDAAHLRAAQGAKPFGQRMLIDVQDRLTILAKNEASKVGKQPYEALMGMTGILTESCLVWWSEKFDLEEQQ
jgi:hypothetical protein